MSKPLDRDRLRKLLGLLASDQDGEVLNAARRVVELLKASDISWDALLPDQPASRAPDYERLHQLLASNLVSDVWKIRLRAMRSAALGGRLSPADRRMIDLLHRKAFDEGSVIVA